MIKMIMTTVHIVELMHCGIVVVAKPSLSLSVVAFTTTCGLRAEYLDGDFLNRSNLPTRRRSHRDAASPIGVTTCRDDLIYLEKKHASHRTSGAPETIFLTAQIGA